jgi:hypothetical protein
MEKQRKTQEIDPLPDLHERRRGLPLKELLWSVLVIIVLAGIWALGALEG